MKNIIAIFIVLMILCNSCKELSNHKTGNTIEFKGTSFYLADNDVKIVLPPGFKASSRYRIRQDIPFLSTNQLLLNSYQTQLEIMEFQDKEIDVFVDTTSLLHLIVIADFEYTPLDQTTGSLLAKQIKEQNNQTEQDSNGEIAYQKLETSFKQGLGGVYFKFKYKISQLSGEDSYSTYYILSGKNRSYFIHEFTSNSWDLESSVANMKS